MEEPSNIDQLLKSALESMQNRKFAEADSLLLEALSINPNQHDALRLLGISAGQRGDFLRAIDWLIKAVQTRPESAQSHHDLGVVLAELGQIEEALNSFNLALHLKPRFPSAHVSIGNILSKIGRQTEAAEAFEKALRLQPGMAEAEKGLRRIESDCQTLKHLVGAIRNSSPGFEPSEQNEPVSDLQLPRRELFPHLLNEFDLTGYGAEIGVQEGRFSSILLHNWKGKRLYSIDPWKQFPSDLYEDVANVSQATHDENYRNTIKLLMPYQSKSVIWRLTSREASELIPDESLDFCYLDGDHSSRGVREDLQLWEPKVKSGGILAGHDYIPDGTYSFGIFGVRGAVDEFVASRKLRLYMTAETDKNCPSWLVFKKPSCAESRSSTR